MIEKDFYFFNDSILEEKILTILKENQSNVLIVDYKDDYVWLKRPRESKSTFLHKLFYNTTRIRGLMPVEDKNKQETLYHEVTKLKRLKGKGINVPEVLGCREDFFVLENTGKCLKNYLKEPFITDTFLENTLESCVDVLSSMHNSSEYHAGPQIKNYTLKEDTVSAIDFEDSFSKNIKLEDIQFRDFFLFLVSLTELNKEINYKEIINIYKKNTKNETIDKELKNIALNINFLTKIVEIEFLNKRFSKDVLNNYTLFKTLQQL
ncbi:MAG: hypothetical protein C0625_10620 [Arcobacter sp.]|nr:MAG: hypothetical protein C0625_10620 [Arcobacter sp.]